MIKTRRANRHNFADDGSVATQAVATANLVSILDPDKVDSDGVSLIADATGTQEEFVENLTTLVDEANEAVGTIDEVEVIENYSNKVRKLVGKAKLRKNFAEGTTEADKITDAAAIVSMVDDEALDCCKSSEIAEVISEATGADEKAVEAIVELSKENFSAGVKYAQKKQRRIDRQNFSHLHFAELAKDEAVPDSPVKPNDPVPAEPDAVKNRGDDPVVDSTLPKTGSEGLEQNPDLAKNDPTPANVIEKLSPVPAGEAMAVQNELATVQGVANVPDAASNFSRGKKQSEDCSILKSLLGKDYVE